MSEHARQLAQQLLDTLTHTRIDSLEGLEAILRPPAESYRLLAPRTGGHAAPSNEWLDLSTQDKAYILRVYFARIQHVLATKIAVDWLAQLRANPGGEDIWLAYFGLGLSSSAYSATAARLTLSTLLAVLSNKPPSKGLSSVQSRTSNTPLHPIVVNACFHILAGIVKTYTLKAYHNDIFRDNSSRSQLEWESFINLYISLPAKLANLDRNTDIPECLEWRAFLLTATHGFEVLVADEAKASHSANVPSLTYLVGKFVRSGFIAYTPGPTNFWQAILPKLKRRLLSGFEDVHGSLYTAWAVIVQDLSSPDLVALSKNLVTCLSDELGNASQPLRYKQSAVLLVRVLGPLRSASTTLWDVVVQKVFLEKQNASLGVGRLLVAWVLCSNDNDVSARGESSAWRLVENCHEPDVCATASALSTLLQRLVPIWCDKQTIERSSPSYNACEQAICLTSAEAF